jgi:hypothetical protein
VLVAIAAGAWLLLRTPASQAPTEASHAHQLPAVRRAALPLERWTITEQFAAQHALVIQVETRHLGDALRIAKEIAGPLEARYTEILVYFHRPGRPDTLPPRRIQWTRVSGYVETDFEAR